MLSDVTYPCLSGTNVARDFVELPSQLYEHWLDRPEVLRRFARHYETGEPMPKALVDRVKAARLRAGFRDRRVPRLRLFRHGGARLPAAPALDARRSRRERWRRGHARGDRPPPRRAAFPARVLRRRLFRRLLLYLWSEVLDADAFEAFVESRRRVRSGAGREAAPLVYAAGGKRPPDELWRRFAAGRPTPRRCCASADWRHDKWMTEITLRIMK